MKGITIYHFTERVTLIALDEFGIFFIEKVARIVISQLQSARQLPQTFSKSNKNISFPLGFRSD